MAAGIDFAHNWTWYVVLRNPWGHDTYSAYASSYHSYTADTTYHDGWNNNFNDGIIRVTWATFSQFFNFYYVNSFPGLNTFGQ